MKRTTKSDTRRIKSSVSNFTTPGAIEASSLTDIRKSMGNKNVKKTKILMSSISFIILIVTLKVYNIHYSTVLSNAHFKSSDRNVMGALIQEVDHESEESTSSMIEETKKPEIDVTALLIEEVDNEKEESTSIKEIKKPEIDVTALIEEDDHKKEESTTIKETEKPEIVIFFNTYIHQNKTELGSNIINLMIDQISRQPLLHDADIYYTRFGDLDTPWPESKCTRNGSRKCHEIKSAEKGDEIDTLEALHEYCSMPSNQHHRVIYMHNKGSFTESRVNTAFRAILLTSILSDACINMPQNGSCSTCSSQFKTDPFFHYIGNMFLAECSYVRKLLPPRDYVRAREALVKTMFEHTSPSKFIPSQNYITDIPAGAATKSDSNSSTPALSYTFGSSSYYAIERDSWLGVGRYASEHYILSHPDANPCDVFSPIEILNGHMAYDRLVIMDKYLYRLANNVIHPKLSIIPDVVRRGEKNESVAINGCHVEEVCNSSRIPHPWFQKEGRVFQLNALYPESGGVKEDGWLYDFWKNLEKE